MEIWEVTEVQIKVLIAINEKGMEGKHGSSIHQKTRNSLLRLKLIRKNRRKTAYLKLSKKGIEFLRDKVGIEI